MVLTTSNQISEECDWKLDPNGLASSIIKLIKWLSMQPVQLQKTDRSKNLRGSLDPNPKIVKASDEKWVQTIFLT